MLDTSILEKCPPFRAANTAASKVLLVGGAVVRYKAGATMWTSGAPCRGLFVILGGEVRVLGVNDGRSHVVHSEGRGATLGEAALFDRGRMPASAIAATDVTCAVFSPETVRAAIVADPEIGLVLLNSLAQRVRGLVNRLSQRTSQSATSRLAAYLIHRQAAAGGGEFTLGGSQQAVAEELGTVREVVVRALRRFKASGALESVGRRRFRIADEARLRREWGERGATPHYPRNSRG